MKFNRITLGRTVQLSYRITIQSSILEDRVGLTQWIFWGQNKVCPKNQLVSLLLIENITNDVHSPAYCPARLLFRARIGLTPPMGPFIKYVSTFLAIFDTPIPISSLFLYLSVIISSLNFCPPPPKKKKCRRTLWTTPIAMRCGQSMSSSCP